MKLRDLEFVIPPYQKVHLFYDKGLYDDTVVIKKVWCEVAGFMKCEVISIWSNNDDTLGIRVKETY